MDNDNEQLNKVYEQLRDWIAKYPGLISNVPHDFPFFNELRNTAEAYHDLNGKTPAPEEIRNAFSKTIKILGRRGGGGRGDLPDIYESRSGFKILPFQFEQINPAWTIRDGELWILHPLTNLKRVTVGKGDDMHTVEVESVDNFIITSNHDAFPCNIEIFRKAHVLAKIPDTTLDSRWSVPSILEHLNGETTVEPFEIFKRIRDTWSYYLDLDNIPGAYTVSALWDIYTYFYRLFSHTPYKWYTGKTRTAKSKNGTLDWLLAFNAFSTVDMTGPNLFRAIQETAGTLIIDEFEKAGKNRNKSEKQQDVDSIINAGFQAFAKVSRLEKFNGRQVRVTYDVFAPKVICGISDVGETLENRSYKFPTLRTNDRKKSRREPDPKNPQWQGLRDSLYTLMMNHWREVETMARGALENRLDLSDRSWSKAKPLVTIAQFVANYAGDEGHLILADLWDFLKFQEELEKEQAIDSFDYSIFESLSGLVNSTSEPEPEQILTIQLALLTEQVATLEGLDITRINKTHYGRSLRKEIERLAIGQNFHRGSGNVLVFETSKSIVRSCKERYFTNDNVQDGNYGNSDTFDNYGNYGNSNESLAKLPIKPDGNSFDNSLETKENSVSPEGELSKLPKLSHSATPEKESDGNGSHDPITLEDGNLIRDQLLNLGYIVDPNSGKDLNEEYYKIGIIGVSARGVKLDKLSRIMDGEKFDLFNDLNQRIIWYRRPLRGDSK